MGEILSSRVVSPSPPDRPQLDAALMWRERSFPFTALIDSGVDESFIDSRVCQQLGIETEPLNVPLDTKPLNQGWANFLTHGPQWVLKFDRGTGPGTDGCSVCVN